MRKFFSWHWDFIGFGASLLCALHCMLLPIVFSLGIFTGVHWLINPFGEWIFIGISIGIAAWSLLQSYFKKHQNIRPLLIAGLGLLGLLLVQARVISYPHSLMAVGGGLIAYAHFYNWQLSRQLETTAYWNATSRIVTTTLVLLYSFGLYSAFTQERTPPSSKEMLELVWQVPD
ncbi:MAG: MerC domain-containing protein [Bacteroidota bacterium]